MTGNHLKESVVLNTVAVPGAQQGSQKRRNGTEVPENATKQPRKKEQEDADLEAGGLDVPECTVCLERPRSRPIHACSNGHVVCSDCLPRVAIQ